jgi:hypothetical protein
VLVVQCLPVYSMSSYAHVLLTIILLIIMEHIITRPLACTVSMKCMYSDHPSTASTSS